MKNIICLLILTLLPVNGYAQDAKLCHIAGPGFYATDGKKGVLFDALFNYGLDGYEMASDELNEQMENAQGDFSDVRIVFASHYHADHMTGKSILRHLRANEESVAIIPEQARIVMTAAGMQSQEQGRVKSYRVPIGENQKLSDMPFPTTLYGISHGEGRPIENIGLAVTVAGKTIMHVGDMFAKTDDLVRAGISDIEVDYLLLPFWFTMSEEGMSQINGVFNAKHIIPMHFPPEYGAMSDGPERLANILEASHKAGNNMVALHDEMACVLLK